MAYSGRWIARQRDKGVDILVAEKTPQEVYAAAGIMRRFGYEPKTQVLQATDPVLMRYYQWWKVAARESAVDEAPSTAIKWSARREGLVPMPARSDAVEAMGGEFLGLH